MMRILIFLTASFIFFQVQGQIITVYPGDASNNGAVTNVDLLYVGIHYGRQGPARDSAEQNIIWTPYQTLAWQGNPVGPVNAAHSDCNGNGIVNTFDTDAIDQNYGNSTLFANPENYNSSVTGATPLSINIPPDSITGGSVLLVAVSVSPSGNQPIDSLYGIAFSIAYDSSVVDCVFADFNGSILGGGGFAPLSLFKDDRNRGLADFAITRINQTNIAAVGVIGTVGIVMDDNLKTWGTDVASMGLSLVNVVAIDRSFNQIPMEHFGDSATILSGRSQPSVAHIQVYPQPASEWVHLRSDFPLQSFVLRDIQGKVISGGQFNRGGEQALQIKGIIPGIYFLEVNSSQGTLRKKVLIH